MHRVEHWLRAHRRGVRLRVDPPTGLAEIEYHLADYDAEADWNLVSRTMRAGAYAVCDKAVRLRYFGPLVQEAMQENMVRRSGDAARIQFALQATGGNVSDAARRLEISRRTFYRRMRQLGISNPWRQQP